MADLAILIVSYNARADLARTLESLQAAPPTTPSEIVVVDNASADGSATMVRERWPDVRVVEAGTNVGFARGNNLGIRATQSEFVLLLNSDTVVPPGAVDGLVAELRARPGAAIAGPRLVGPDGRVEISSGRMMAPFTELAQKIKGALYARGFGPVRRLVEREARRARAVDWVSGACLLVRRADAEAVGLLDERFFLYTEDVDFCAAVRARQRVVWFTPAVQVVHARGRSRQHDPHAAHALYRRSHLAFYEKHHRRWAPLLRLYLTLRGQTPDKP